MSQSDSPQEREDDDDIDASVHYGKWMHGPDDGVQWRQDRPERVNHPEARLDHADEPAKDVDVEEKENVDHEQWIGVHDVIEAFFCIISLKLLPVPFRALEVCFGQLILGADDLLADDDGGQADHAK